MNNYEQTPHFAKTIADMFGAQMAARMLDEFWVNATEDQKAMVANAVAARFNKDDGSGGWEVRHAVDSAIRKWADGIVESKMDEMIPKIEKRVFDHLEKRLQDAVDGAIQEGSKKLANKVLAAFRGY